MKMFLWVWHLARILQRNRYSVNDMTFKGAFSNNFDRLGRFEIPN
jgi:hypothetical protein